MGHSLGVSASPQEKVFHGGTGGEHGPDQVWGPFGLQAANNGPRQYDPLPTPNVQDSRAQSVGQDSLGQSNTTDSAFVLHF